MSTQESPTAERTENKDVEVAEKSKGKTSRALKSDLQQKELISCTEKTHRSHDNRQRPRHIVVPFSS